MVAGRPSRYSHDYLARIKGMIVEHSLEKHVSLDLEFIPDTEVERYFMAADCSALPYKDIFQSGVLFLSYSMGLPVIATDVGNFRQDVIDGDTGFICRPEDPADLADKTRLYFRSDLYANLEQNRDRIRRYANEKYAWSGIAKSTLDVYNDLIRLT